MSSALGPVCAVRGPNGEECDNSPGHSDLHRCMVERGTGVSKPPWDGPPIPTTEYEVVEWNDDGKQVLDRPEVGRALRRKP